jgi:eukaryotic-like serine/threonine-protein kinase
MMAPSLAPTHQLGRFRILDQIGEGGMGTVYLAEDDRQRRVALKVPRFSPDEDPELLRRFYREARAASRIDHPNVCPVFEVGQAGGIHYMAMPYVEGTPLSRQSGAGRAWPPRPAVELVRQLALAAAALHEQGIVHRDLKPGNVLVRPDGGPVLMDFGLARPLGNCPAGLTLPSAALTVAGTPVGTPAYMSPEQALGDSNLGPAADIYSLGVVLYELLAGRRPFDGPLAAVYAQILHSPPEPPSALRPDLDAALDGICLKALAKKPDHRFTSMTDFARALSRYLEAPVEPPTPPPISAATRPQPPRRWRKPTLAGLLLCGLAWGLGLLDLPHPVVPTRPPAREITNSLGMKLRRIPPGTFLMGSPAGEDGRHDDEDMHEVTISTAFFLGAHEVTVGQFRAFVAETGYRTDTERDHSGGCAYDLKRSCFVRGTAYSWRNPGWEQTDDHPVVNVSWHDAAAFCAWLSHKEGKTYELPSEAEWEYACRAGTLSRFATGEETESLVGAANVADASARRLFPSWTTTRGEDGFVFTAPAGRFRPNAWGLHDMHGNAWEWCADWYGPYSRSAVTDPPGPSHGPGRVLRGGSWFGSPRHCRAANRFHQPAAASNVCFGFRVTLRAP